MLALKTATLPAACTTNTIFVGEYEIIIINSSTPYATEPNRFDAQMREGGRVKN